MVNEVEDNEKQTFLFSAWVEQEKFEISPYFLFKHFEIFPILTIQVTKTHGTKTNEKESKKYIMQACQDEVMKMSGTGMFGFLS